MRARTGMTAAVLVSLCMLSCKVVNDSGDGNTLSVKDFRITNEMSGWSEVATEGYLFYDPQGLFGPMDGGAPPYVDNGLKDGIMQKLRASGGRSNKVYVMDFTSEEMAAHMAELKKVDVPDPKSVGTFPQTTAFAKEMLTGVDVYGHMSKYYFEMSLTNYTDLAQASSDAAMFLGVYEAKVK